MKFCTFGWSIGDESITPRVSYKTKKTSQLYKTLLRVVGRSATSPQHTVSVTIQKSLPSCIKPSIIWSIVWVRVRDTPRPGQKAPRHFYNTLFAWLRLSIFFLFVVSRRRVLGFMAAVRGSICFSFYCVRETGVGFCGCSARYARSPPPFRLASEKQSLFRLTLSIGLCLSLIISKYKQHVLALALTPLAFVLVAVLALAVDQGLDEVQALSLTFSLSLKNVAMVA